MSKQSKHTSVPSRPSQKRNEAGERIIRFKCSLQNTVLDVLRNRSWQEVVGDGEWDLYWCDVGWMKEYFDHYFMEENMKICHFRNHYELTRKNLMVKNLKRYRKQTERDQGKVEAQKCDFFPMTFELPTEYHMFVEEFKKNPGQIWIMKPVAKSQGKGIFLFRKLKDIVDWKKSPQSDYQVAGDAAKETPESYVVQRYLDDPYLIGGRKFDLRVYVLVTSYIPLKIWVYREGFARLSNTRFSLDTIDDTYVHLTNVAVQKMAPDYDPEKGSKWSVRQLRIYLNARHGKEQVDLCFQLIDDIFIRSLLSVQKIMVNDKHCFELYGYDILLDFNLKPWLLEVNASPSLTASSQEDYELKCRLLDDVLNVIDLENRLAGKEKAIGGFDLMWDDGPVYVDPMFPDSFNPSTSRLNSFLGCINERRLQLRQLYKSLQITK